MRTKHPLLARPLQVGLALLLGLAAASDVLAQTISGIPPRAWFRADQGVAVMRPPNDTTVTGWADQAGRGNNLVVEHAGPMVVSDSLNGLPSLTFPGYLRYRNAPWDQFFSADANTVFLVCREDGLEGLQTYFALVFGDENWFRFASTADRRLVWQAGHGDDALQVDQPANWKGRWHVVTLHVAKGVSTIRVDGRELGFRTGVRPAAFVGADTFFLGESGIRDSQFYGAMAELLFYGTALDAADLASVEGYLAGKYALPIASAFAPIHEPFDYDAGTDVGLVAAAGWQPHRTPPGAPITIAAGSLTSTTGPSLVAGHVELLSGTDGAVRKQFTSTVDFGTIYASMVLRLQGLQSLDLERSARICGFLGTGWVATPKPTPCPTDAPEPEPPTCPTLQVFFRAQHGGYQLGLGKQTATAGEVVFADQIHRQSEVVFFVLGYTFMPGGEPDIARLWVAGEDPAWFAGATPPPPTLQVTSGLDLAEVDSFVLYQWAADGGTPGVTQMDDLRIGSNWRDILPPPDDLRRMAALSCYCHPFSTRPDPDPLWTTWFTEESDALARVRLRDGGPLVTTWDGQPDEAGVYADVQKIQSSDENVYVTASGLASHVMGAWYTDMARNKIFPHPPVDQGLTIRFPRHPSRSVFRHDDTGLGAIGFWVNGTAIYNMFDGFFYSPAEGADAAVAGKTGTWNRDAYVGERWAFDPVYFHQAANQQQYHSHVHPIALRLQLGDNLVLDPWTGTHREDPPPRKHSPILGWALDGHPIYGPYGYADPDDADSGIRLMIPGYVLRNGSFGTTNLDEAGRKSLPYWAQVAQNRTTADLTDSADWGPPTDQAADRPLGSDELSFALGRYAEDWDYLGDLPARETDGLLWDLDRYNGRCGVTPEFPDGTYAYFVTVDSDGNPLFPYVTGRQFCGQMLGEEMPAGATIDEDTTIQFWRIHLGRPYSLGGTPGSFEVRLSWRGESGAVYLVESSADLQTWRPLRDIVPAADGTATFVHKPAPEADPHRFYRVVPVTRMPAASAVRAPSSGAPQSRQP